MVRMGWASGDSAANLLAMTRTCQGPLPLAGTRITSVGVLISLPMQNGQPSTKAGTTLAGRLVANSSGRLARSVAMLTHSLVKYFWRSSGIFTPHALLSAEIDFSAMCLFALDGRVPYFSHGHASMVASMPVSACCKMQFNYADEDCCGDPGRNRNGRAALCADAGASSVVRDRVAGCFRPLRRPPIRGGGTRKNEDAGTRSRGRNARISRRSGGCSENYFCGAGYIDCC